MSFTSIDVSETAEGQPVSANTHSKIKENLDAHEDRLQAQEQRALTVPPVIFRINGRYGAYGPRPGVLTTEVTGSYTIVGARLLIDSAGTSDSTTVNIRRKRAGITQQIFTTLPTASYLSGDNYLSPTGIIDPAVRNIDSGDLLILDIETVQTNGIGFLVRLDIVPRLS